MVAPRSVNQPSLIVEPIYLLARRVEQAIQQRRLWPADLLEQLAQRRRDRFAERQYIGFGQGSELREEMGPDLAIEEGLGPDVLEAGEVPPALEDWAAALAG